MPLLVFVLLEIVVLLAVGSWIGVGWTLLALLASTVLGVLLARREGARALRALSGAGRRGALPAEEVTDGLLIALGGVLFIVPGFVSDLLGLLLLLPPTRHLIGHRMVRAAERRTPGLRTLRIRTGGPIIDGSVDGSVDGSTRGSATRRPTGAPVIDGTVVDGTVVDGTVVDEPDTSGRPDLRKH
ncbi:FxsA family protein [Nakamurella leprariae]|uniref:FxsA family protein n=1 Tax=Nakamurella leprariae TaxID=2803911 RepID=A0A938YEL9_9ACTN|nr:FxsA family protein [Nakamurella leprariae]MBM9466769.1 FxsA family protein [Nakamurella leprariae]